MQIHSSVSYVYRFLKNCGVYILPPSDEFSRPRIRLPDVVHAKGENYLYPSKARWALVWFPKKAENSSPAGVLFRVEG